VFFRKTEIIPIEIHSKQFHKCRSTIDVVSLKKLTNYIFSSNLSMIDQLKLL